MSVWWYVEKDKKIGPVDKAELKNLIQTEKIDSNTILWCEGMEAWLPLASINELRYLTETLPPPIPKNSNADPLSFPLATRWPRFFARLIDTWVETIFISIILGAVLGLYYAWFVEWINKPGSSQLFGLICLPIAFTLDAIIFSIFGNTLGKALLGLRVGSIDGKQLNFAQYLERNFSIWKSGFAFGVPLFNLYTMAKQSNRVIKYGVASYDELTGYRVRAKPIGLLRKILFGVLFLSVLVALGALKVMEEDYDHKILNSSLSQDYEWINPHTNLSTKVDSKWKNSSAVNEANQKTYMFTEITNHAVIVFGLEQAENTTLDTYIRAFKNNNNKNMSFNDGGSFVERDGRSVWSGSGKMIVDSTTNILNVEVVQIEGNFWRVVSIQGKPYDYSDKLVMDMRDRLLKTIK